MPARPLLLTQHPDGSVSADLYNVTLPADLVDQLKRGEMGGTRLARLLDLPRGKGAHLLNRMRSELWKGDEEVQVPYSRQGDGDFLRVPPAFEMEGVTAGEQKPDPDAVLCRLEERFRKKDAEAAAKNWQHLRVQHGPVCLAFVGDQHIGNSGTNHRRMFEDAELLASMPATHLFMMGDLTDQFIVQKLLAIRLLTSATIPEEHAVAEKYVETIAPVLRGTVGGNHDYWSVRMAGYDTLRSKLPPETLYDQDELTVRVAVGPAVFSVIMRHKWKGYSMYNPFHPHGRASRQERPGHDIYVGAHTHNICGVSPVVQGGKLVAAVQCNTYKRLDTYSKQQGFQESNDQMVPCVILWEDGTWEGVNNLHRAAELMRLYYPERKAA